jgi:putative transposase
MRKSRGLRRYAGCMSMSSIHRQLVDGIGRLRCQGGELSREARLHLQWMRFYETHGRNARLTCRRFGISPQTFYRWKRRYDPDRLTTLENRSSRPKKLRQPTWTRELEVAVLQLREQYPRWGKAKLKVLLLRKGLAVSVSMVGRVLKRLKQSGRLVEPLRRSRRFRRRQPRVYAVRKPWDYLVHHPGDLVQVDTKDLRPLPGIRLKQFTARDRISRWDVFSVHERATSRTAAAFLDDIQKRMPFPVKAIQVDGGSEFKAVFETECQKRGIRLFALPPRSPKLNAHVERSNRTHAEEFHDVYDLPWSVATLKPACLAWERVYNTVRPHQSLGMKTPLEFVNAWRRSQLGRKVSPKY